MKKLGFVTPWFGEKIAGGAEMELRGLVEHLHAAGVELEVLTTCVKDFASDWNDNFYKPGQAKVNDIDVRRFKVRKRNVAKFDAVNLKLMQNKKVIAQEEETYVNEMVNSTDLYRYMEEHKDEYALFIFIPYMFGTTYFGCQVCPEKSVLIPCFHDESYVRMECFKKAFSKVAGAIYHAQPEYDLINGLYDMSQVNQKVLGEGVYTDLTCHAQDFRDKFHITDDFILYAGRKDAGKNINTLISHFARFKQNNQNSLKLVLIGGGEVKVPDSIKDDVIDLGFVDIQDKYNAEAAAMVLCQPSKNESFSLVIMESWLCKRPVLVCEDCAVTKNFVQVTNGGLYFRDYYDFEGCINYYLNHRQEADLMGVQGRSYVLENFAWDVIVERYTAFFEELEEQSENK